MSALVLLHGFTGSPASWDAVAAALPGHGETSALLRETLVGHGDPAHDTAAGFEGEVDRLAARLGARGVTTTEPAHLVGYSLGGRVALGLLARHGGLFRSATLVSAHPGLGSDEERRARADSDERWARLAETEGTAAFVAAWEKQDLFASQARLPAADLEAQRAIRLGHRPEGLARALRILSLSRMPDFRPAAPEIPCPVGLVVGEDDARFVAQARALLPRLRAGTLTVVAGAGHNVPLETPDTLARLVARDAAQNLSNVRQVLAETERTFDR